MSVLRDISMGGLPVNNASSHQLQQQHQSIQQFLQAASKQQSYTFFRMSDYKPTEHDGLRKDGQPDKRVGTGGIYPPFTVLKVPTNDWQSLRAARSTQ